jgi:YidC/Oxa1 family membrane protein insertase
MENQRLLIWGTFGLMAWFTYQAWMADYGPRAQPPQQTPEMTQEPGADAGNDVDLPALSDDAAPSSGTRSDTQSATDTATLAVIDSPILENETTDSNVIRVTTDVLDIEINTSGGTLQHATLKKYPVAKDRPNDLVALLSTEPRELGLIQTGLRTANEGEEPNHRASFTTAAREFDMGGNDELLVPLTWTNNAGVTVVKEFQFTRGSYRIDVSQTVVNDSSEVWRGAEYAQIRRRSFETERSMFNVDTYSNDGPVVYNGEKSEKMDRDDLMSDGPVSLAGEGGWTATIQHHFLSAVVPPVSGEYRYNVSASNNVAVSSMIGPTQSIPPGGEFRFDTTLFVGPKLQSQLEDVDKTLKLTVDYGWLTVLSQPLFWVLAKVHSVVGNWGWAIILVTVLIKMLFYKLTQASGRSMAKMREIQPRMKALQDRYKDDRQALSQAMMELYKREKVNPAAGCLPILIQMPFFLAFYWVLLESVEMRQAPFMLWITDLSSRDPFFILPLIMGVAMFFQQKLNPAPADPVQAKVMQIMPIMFTGFFAFFPSGLVLYWVTNTLLSIAQQWRINKVVHEETERRKGNKKKEKKEKKEKKKDKTKDNEDN